MAERAGNEAKPGVARRQDDGGARSHGDRAVLGASRGSVGGDTIKVGRGTYQGGITIDVSVRLAGAGAGYTIIRGGDHVLTVGALGASSEPVVSISGVTITGGLARSSQESVPYWGKNGVVAAGGGIEIPPQAVPADGLPVNGATVTISDSVITGNIADPVRAIPAGPPCPGGKPCPIAWAFGAGIDSWGNLTLLHTTVSDNIAGLARRLRPESASSRTEGAMSPWHTRH